MCQSVYAAILVHHFLSAHRLHKEASPTSRSSPLPPVHWDSFTRWPTLSWKSQSFHFSVLGLQSQVCTENGDYNHRCAVLYPAHLSHHLHFDLFIGGSPSHELWYTCKGQRAGFLKSLLSFHLFWSRVTSISVTSAQTPGYLAHGLLSLLPISQQECRNYKCMPPHLTFYMGFRGWTQVFGLAWLALLQTEPIFSAQWSFFVVSGEIPEWSPEWVCIADKGMAMLKTLMPPSHQSDKVLPRWSSKGMAKLPSEVHCECLRQFTRAHKN